MRALRRRTRSRGQALVEFALVVPIFFGLLFGFIDVARYVYTTTAYGQAAREGARYGSVEQWSYSCPGTVVTQSRKNCTEATTLGRVPAGAPTPSSVVFTCPTACRAGDLMSVTVAGTFNFFTPGITNLLGTPQVSQGSQVVIQ
jgi:Flp pilus assembly protein TadG